MRLNALRTTFLAMLLLSSASTFAVTESEAIKTCSVSSDSLARYRTCLVSLLPGVQGTALATAQTKTSFCTQRVTNIPRFNEISTDVCYMTKPLQNTSVLSLAADANSCDDKCKAISDPLNFLSNDPKCDRDPACKSCVAGKISNQAQTYCTAYNLASKAKRNQTPPMVMYGLAATMCGLACTIGKTPYGAWTEPVCTGLGVGIFAAELLGLGKQTSLDGSSKKWLDTVSGLGKNAVGMAQTSMVLTNGTALLKGGDAATKLTTKILGKTLSDQTINCAAAVMYGVVLGQKAGSLGKFEKTKKSNCDEIKKLTERTQASPIIAECKTQGDVLGGGGGGFPYSPPSGLPKFDIKDPTLSHLVEDDGKLGPHIGKMFEFASKDPELTRKLNEIGQKIQDEGGIEGALSQYGQGNEHLAGLQDIIKESENGGMLSMDLTGSDTRVASLDENAAPTNSEYGSSELRFGSSTLSSATPQEGAEALAVGRSPASDGAALKSRDPFDPSDQRDLFRKASDQLKNQCSKKNVLSLAPESRMNRMLSGTRSGADREAK